jgi:hypothetical protein
VDYLYEGIEASKSSGPSNLGGRKLACLQGIQKCLALLPASTRIARLVYFFMDRHTPFVFRIMLDSHKVEESRNALHVNMIGERLVNGKLNEKALDALFIIRMPSSVLLSIHRGEVWSFKEGFLTAVGLVSSISKSTMDLFEIISRKRPLLEYSSVKMLHRSLSLTSGFLLCQNPATTGSISSSLA